jgi:hypothetical protein
MVAGEAAEMNRDEEEEEVPGRSLRRRRRMSFGGAQRGKASRNFLARSPGERRTLAATGGERSAEG